MTDGRGPTGTEPDEGRQSEREEPNPEIEAERTKELRALLGLLGRASGLTHVPSFDPRADQPALPDVDEAVNDLKYASFVSEHARLEVLARLVRAQQAGRAQGDLTDLAGSLLPADTPEPVRVSTASELIKRVSQSQVGEEPLGRSIADLHHVDAEDAVARTTDQLRTAILAVWPGCDAKDTSARGVQALNIITDVYTTTPLNAFTPIIDPTKWYLCALESRFFAPMQLVPPQTGYTPTLQPDKGWQATLLETVDFGFGIWPRQEAKTELDFVYFFNPTQAGQRGAAGCTYDFHHSPDGKISVDQGYLLVEDLGPPINARRYRTQKIVHMTQGDPPPDAVCDFWSVAVGLIQQACATQLAGPPATP